MAITKRIKEYISINLPYYKGIKRKYRYDAEVKDKAWAILSDYVRCRDFIKYKRCVATGRVIAEWRDSDAGHFITMGGHGAQLGFHELNVHAQNGNSNRQSSPHEGADFEREIVRRHGQETVDMLRKMEQESPVKADEIFFIEKIKRFYTLFKQLKAEYPNHNYPDYI